MLRLSCCSGSWVVGHGREPRACADIRRIASAARTTRGTALTLLGSFDLGDLELLFGPRGISTATTSFFFAPIRALPIGDSLESLCSAGSASAAPTSLNFCDLPDFWSLTWTTAPTSTCSVSTVLLVDHLGAAELVLKLGDALLEHRLLVLGVVVLGVLGDVAELARLLDAIGDLAALVGLERSRALP